MCSAGDPAKRRISKNALLRLNWKFRSAGSRMRNPNGAARKGRQTAVFDGVCYCATISTATVFSATRCTC